MHAAASGPGEARISMQATSKHVSTKEKNGKIRDATQERNARYFSGPRNIFLSTGRGGCRQAAQSLQLGEKFSLGYPFERDAKRRSRAFLRLLWCHCLQDCAAGATGGLGPASAFDRGQGSKSVADSPAGRSALKQNLALNFEETISIELARRAP